MYKAIFPGYTIGPDAYQDIPAVCAPYGKKVAIIGGKKAMGAALDAILAAIDGTLEVIGTFWYGGEASYENVEMLKPQAAEADMLFAIGGGKAIDTVKVLAHQTNRPFFTFPTIASTCASVTSLGIVYHPDGSLNEYSFSKIPPNHAFINTQVIANAPDIYLWAGIGDSLSKYYECTVSARNQVLTHADEMGVQICAMCGDPLMANSVQAMEDCKAHRVSQELENAILCIIVSTGFVSNFVRTDYNNGVAHALYNGFTIDHGVESHHHLHGEIVAYGIPVLLHIDGQEAERDKVYAFNRSLGLPVCLADIHATPELLPEVAVKALKGTDCRVYPYKVTEEMLVTGVLAMEDYHAAHS